MPLFVWSKDYSVGVERFDDEHKKLFGMMNNLHDAMREGRGKSVMADVLKELVDYTHYHFQHEEKVMKEHFYPQLAAHQQAHKDLTDRVIEYQEQYESGKRMLSVEMVEFLVDWLKKHIAGVDKQYTEFLNSKGVA
jgi:hemerythrin